jgi:hypothetical protein
MSLTRAVYLGAVLCGWMALIGWFSSEVLRQSVERFDRPPGPPTFLGSEALGAALTNDTGEAVAGFFLVGSAVGAGLGLAAGLSNSTARQQLLRMVRGLVAGGLGGAAGGWIGGQIYHAFQISSAGNAEAGEPFWLRPLGWMIAGTLVGVGEGLFALSPSRIRNGAIGGLVGGLLGGALFNPLGALVARTATAGTMEYHFDMTSRAVGLVVVGLCIGAAVGLTHLLLKHAWLTVLDGDRPGRQVILSGGSLTLGSDPAAGLSFTGAPDRTLFPHHLRISRGRDGSFALQPASSSEDAEVIVNRSGVRHSYNFKGNTQSIVLENDCVIVCGRNSIRFNERYHNTGVGGPTPPTVPSPVPFPPQARPVPHPVPQPQPVVGSPPSPVSSTQRTGTATPGPGAHPAAPSPVPPAQPVVRTSDQAQRPTPAPSPVPSKKTVQDTPASVPPSPPIRPIQPARTPPQPKPQPPVPSENTCPNGHKLPPGQRYCIVCDTEF